jgi:glycosyltransferase involved in cell wall biosynthesis
LSKVGGQRSAVSDNRKLYLALPCLNEADYIPSLLSCIRKQTSTNFELFVCVNQPEAWWNDPAKRYVCEDNQRTLEILYRCTDLPLTVIDRASPGKGWIGNQSGVGWARNTVMDAINAKADQEDIILSIDADTTFSGAYLESIRDSFIRHPSAAGLSVPYYHLLTGDETTDRCILRYEIYMRHYALNMWRIRNRYRFTAIGSAMACPVRAYRAVGGITPHQSGEDFYFLQKLAKYGTILHWNNERVYPAARFSDRVLFGTGPAMIRGRAGDWSSYPIYPYRLFDDIRTTYDLFPALYDKDLETPMTVFLKGIFRTDDLWQPLRKNYRTRERFVRACTSKVDGLRILQYLKAMHRKIEGNDEENLREFIKMKFQISNFKEQKLIPETFDFALSPIQELDAVRDVLAEEEERERCSDVAM